MFPTRLFEVEVEVVPIPVASNMPKRGSAPKVTKQSIEDMIEMVNANRRLYDPSCADHMDSTKSNNILVEHCSQFTPGQSRHD